MTKNEIVVQDIANLFSVLKEEADKRARFPTIFIVVGKLTSWNRLLNWLSGETKIYALSDFCKADDVSPVLPVDAVRKLLTQGRQNVGIVPIGEWLRLKIGAPEKFVQSLAQIEAPQAPRLFVPLFSCEDLLNKSLATLSRWVAGESALLIKLEENPESPNITIIPPLNAPLFQETNYIKGLKNYLSFWERPVKNATVVLASRFAPVLTCKGFGITTLRNSFEIIKAYVPGTENLNEEMATQDFWNWLLNKTFPKATFDEIAKKILNIAEYDFWEVLEGKWARLSPNEKHLFWMWSKLKEPEDFVEDIFFKSLSLDEFGDQLLISPLEEYNKIDKTTLAKRKKAISILGSQIVTSSFWEKFNKCSDNLAKLKSLTGLSQKEKASAIDIVKKLFLDNIPLEGVLEALEFAYPSLKNYLMPCSYVEDVVESLDEYFKLYRRSKILNEQSAFLESLADKISEQQLIWNYPTRQSKIEHLTIPPGNQIWLDGLGLEWVNLIWHSIQKEGFRVSIYITRANLPTITSKNPFPEGAKVFRELDETSHKHIKFPDSLIKQLEVLENIISQIRKTLDTCNRILVTGDHGLTRYEFNKKTISLPKGAKNPHKWGRAAFIEALTPDITSPDKPFDRAWVKQGNEICLLRHGRFEGSKGAPNEVHGGASPEEVLVPVIVIQKVTPTEEITFKVLKEKIRLDASRKGILDIEIIPDTGRLEVRFPTGQEVSGERVDRGKYTFQIQGIKPGRYELTLKTGEKFIGKFTVEIVSAGLEEEDLGI